MEKNKMVVLKQLPEIIVKINEISKEVEEQTQNAMNLVVTDETVKDVKKVRAELNKEFSELESQRKEIKNAIMAKYSEFESVYNEKIKNLYSKADNELKTKIDNVETELKLKKENAAKEYFYELRQSKNLVPYIEFERLGLKITLSTSETALKKQIKEMLDGIENDINLINIENNRDEILVEYLKSLDFAKAKLTVVNRIAQIEKMKREQEEREAFIKAEEERMKKLSEAISKVTEEQIDEITAPTPVAEEIEVTTLSDTEETYIATFQVTATVSQLKALKLFMQENGIKFENI